MLSDKHMQGSKGQKRPADVISTAVHDEPRTDDGKNAAAVALGRKGGEARAKAITKSERVRIAKAGAKARWKAR